jgi:hypothetical protein
LLTVNEGIVKAGIEWVWFACVIEAIADVTEESFAEAATVTLVGVKSPAPSAPVVPVPVLDAAVVEVEFPVLEAAVVEVELAVDPVIVTPEPAVDPVIVTPEPSVDPVIVTPEPPVLSVPVLPVPVLPVPVLSAAVVTPVFEAEVRTEEAPADPVVVPSVALLVPLPSGTLSLKSGTLKVVAPSPTPKVVDTTANRRA